MTQTKSFPAQIKAAEVDGLATGQFEAIVSVFGNVDSYGDVVKKGAFKETLKSWATKGDPIPVIWSHNWNDPDAHIGVVLDAEERDEGLWVRGQLDMDAPKAVQVNRLLKGRRITQFSFAYDVVESAMVKSAGEDVHELRKLHVFEVGPTLLGVNPQTQLLAAKGIGDLFASAVAELKAGRVLSSKNESALRSALDQIAGGMTAVETVLAAIGNDDGKATAAPPTSDPPAKANSEPAGMTPASARLLVDLADFG